MELPGIQPFPARNVSASAQLAEMEREGVSTTLHDGRRWTDAREGLEMLSIRCLPTLWLAVICR